MNESGFMIKSAVNTAVSLLTKYIYIILFFGKNFNIYYTIKEKCDYIFENAKVMQKSLKITCDRIASMLQYKEIFLCERNWLSK
jgi:hypothetical protein